MLTEIVLDPSKLEYATQCSPAVVLSAALHFALNLRLPHRHFFLEQNSLCPTVHVSRVPTRRT